MSGNVRTAVLLSVLALGATAQAARLSEEAYQDLFVKFAKQNDKSYKTDEVFERLQNFKENVDYVLDHNDKPNETFTVGLNQFADWSLTEFEEFLGSGFRAPSDYKAAELRPQDADPRAVSEALAALPEKVDWEADGYMMPVRNQGSCGSCYAFSALGAVEGRWAIARGKDAMSYLSPQSIVDCDRSNYGCSGGFMTNVFDHLIRSRRGHACTEASYPYRNGRKSCKSSCESGAVINSYTDLSRSDSSVAGLMKAVSAGPVAVGVQANSRSIMNYKGGVITGGCPSRALDHAVVLFGYDKDSTGQYYWKLRNSWSERWGTKGNFYVRFNPNSRSDSNLCGVRSMTSFPIISTLKDQSTDYSNLFAELN